MGGHAGERLCLTITQVIGSKTPEPILPDDYPLVSYLFHRVRTNLVEDVYHAIPILGLRGYDPCFNPRPPPPPISLVPVVVKN